MTRLRDALGELAEQAPLVSLADAAIARHRRRRAVRTAAVMAAVVVAMTSTVTAVAAWPRTDVTSTDAASTDAVSTDVTSTDTAGTDAAGTDAAGTDAAGTDAAGTHATDAAARPGAPDLPDGPGAGEISHAYQTQCAHDCPGPEWWVVTRTGTYRVPGAYGDAPVAISRDGRKLAYYSESAGAHVVHDMVTGKRTTSPVRVARKRIGPGSMLALSDDGRHLAFDPREGSKDPGLLIDVRTGATRSIPGVYEVVGIKDGLVSLVRYRRTDLWLMPVTGGGAPVRFKGTFIMFSELNPDGRTVAAMEFEPRRLTLLDARTGRRLGVVPVRSPKGSRVNATGIWLDRHRLVVIAGRGTAYVVDVRTGEARRHASYSSPHKSAMLILPGLGQYLR